MEANIERQGYKKLDLNNLKFSEKSVSTEEALSDIIPIPWEEDILHEKRRVIVKKQENEEIRVKENR